jgi:hypothetical protein
VKGLTEEPVIRKPVFPEDIFCLKPFGVWGVLNSVCAWNQTNYNKIMNPIKLTVVAFAATFGLAAVASADDAAGKLPPASTKQGVTYAADIKPILDVSCAKCHSGDKPKAHLKLDTLENALKGGRNGKVIIPGNSAKSPLVLNAAHLTGDKDLWMPPPHNKANIGPLTPAQIGLLRAWIDQGVK